MKKTIVCIVSEQTTPNYIFIKQMFQIGDELLFISSNQMKSKISSITKTLAWNNVKVNSIIFKNENDEEKWNEMYDQIKKELSTEVKYVVNLTGGTKYMSLVIQRIFEEFNSEFYYIPFPKNYILHLMSESYSPIKIDYRISVDEYLSLHNIQASKKEVTQSKDYTEFFFNQFVQSKLSDDDFSVIDKLRQAYRDKNISISEIENLEIENLEIETKKRIRIENLQIFLDKIKFENKEPGKLYKAENQYLTGGWFEEYIYNLIKERLSPDDIQIGVAIKKTDKTNMNDLDVVFTKGNKLFVIECKTGIGAKKLLNEIIYKASALKGYLLGLPANSYLFSLTKEDVEAEQAASNMGLSYIDKTYFLEEKKTRMLINKILSTAH